MHKEEFEPGSKRHKRTRSLKKASKAPRCKRQSRYGSLEKMSAIATDFEAAYVVYSVGRMPTTF
ncbi:hypothetical protein Plhal304r1_c039g0117101 [Plasmopara halstedii]